MSGRCAACRHPRLAEIDAALASGAGPSAVARQFGLGRTSIRTHNDNGHVPLSMVVLAGTEIAQSRRSVTEMAEHLADQIETGLQAAITGGSPMVIGAYIREMRSLLPLLAQLAPPPPPVAIDYLRSEDYIRLRGVLNAVVCPDCRLALAAALDEGGILAGHSAALTPYTPPAGAGDNGE
jgi:hypothetical protein